MPRATTWEDYRLRIERVTAHLATHLDEPCTLEDLAGVAAFSPCHFHRVFRAVTGEGVAEQRRRLRLERAARRLRMTSQPVVDIALEAGYEAHESFTRAFEAMYGLPPSVFRMERGLAPVRQRLPDLPEVEGEVERIGPLGIVFLRHVGPYSEVGTTFSRLAAWVGAQGLFGPWTQTLGLCHDDPEVVETSRLRYDAAFTVPREVAGAGGIEYRELPERDYVKAVHRGAYALLGLSYAGLIRNWLRRSPRKLADSGSIEFYLNQPEGSSAEALVTEICLPLADE